MLWYGMQGGRGADLRNETAGEFEQGQVRCQLESGQPAVVAIFVDDTPVLENLGNARHDRRRRVKHRPVLYARLARFIEAMVIEAAAAHGAKMAKGVPGRAVIPADRVDAGDRRARGKHI